MNKFVFKVLCLIFLSSCNVLKTIENKDTEVSDNFFFSDNYNCTNCYGDNIPTQQQCPVGYIYMVGNGSFGTSDFCVAQFEMKSVAGVPTSQAALTPWVNITALGAKHQCGTLGSNYDLISNPEWMTIASEIESNSLNWTSGSPGNGMVNRGHSDNSPSSLLAVSNESDDFDGTGNNSGEPAGSGWEQKRTHILSDGSLIWDFAGNAAEFVDWGDGASYSLGPTNCTGGVWFEFNTVPGCSLTSLDFEPNDSSLGSAEGLGKLYGGTGGAAMRGGKFLDGTSAGIYSLALLVGDSYSSAQVGFRCVYRF